jgi:hypothetical protein
MALFSSLSVASSASGSGAWANSFWNPASVGGKSCNTNNPPKDMRFSDMIANSPYTAIKRVQLEYEVFIDNNKLHWLLLIKAKDTEFPYFSLEITTSDFSNIIRNMVLYNTYTGNTIACGSIIANLDTILDVADKVVTAMAEYKLFSNNCQHFCNNFLNQYSFAVYTPTIGTAVTAEVIAMESVQPGQTIRGLFNQLTVGSTEQQLLGYVAAALNRYTGAQT